MLLDYLIFGLYMAGMLTGGISTLLLLTNTLVLPEKIAKFGLDACFYGIIFSAVTFIGISVLWPDKVEEKNSSQETEKEVA